MRFCTRFLFVSTIWFVGLLVGAALSGCALQSPVPVVSPTPPLPPASAAHPNILFILTDDQALTDVQYMPQLKALMADKGVSFSNFFVSTSLCCPSRSSILRGQYSHNTQIYNNVPPTGGFEKFYSLGEEKSTIATWLQQAGYRTGLIGKYLNGYPDTAPLTYVPPGWDEFDSPVDASAYSEYNYRLNANGKLISYGDKPGDYGTTVYQGYAENFIKQATQDHKPFFLYLAPFAPHLPATPAPQDTNLFPDAKVPRSGSFAEADVSDKPKYVQSRHLTPAKINHLDEIYRKRIQSLQAVDRMLTDLVNELQTTGALDNTYIFFASDNGFHLGQHNLDAGKLTPYEEDIHVPLMVRGPNIPAGQVVSQLAVNIDLAPTWLQLAGAAAPQPLDGRSLVPLWQAGASTLPWRQAFQIEYGSPTKTGQAAAVSEPTPAKGSATGMIEPPDPFEREMSSNNPRKLFPYSGLRAQDYMFVHYASGETELYDLKSDPYELQNLAATAPKALLTDLLARATALRQCAGTTCQTLEDQAVPPLPNTSTQSP